MSHTKKSWKIEVEARLRAEVRTAAWIHAKKEYYRCNICFEDVDKEVQRELSYVFVDLEKAQDAKRASLVLYEEFWSMLAWCRICGQLICDCGTLEKTGCKVGGSRGWE